MENYPQLFSCSGSRKAYRVGILKSLFTMIKSLALLAIVLAFAGSVQAQLPVWPHVTRFPQAGPAINTVGLTPHQFIDWTVASPASTDINQIGLNPARSNMAGPTQAGVNGCNELVFFTLHNGEFNAATAALEVYTQGGLYLPLPGGDMNANAGDDEVQIVRRPGYPNQWFVIYSLAPTSWPSTHPGYQSSNIAYSLIEVNSTSAVYVDEVFGNPIQDRILTVGGTAHRYFHGKAVSRTSVTLGANGHDLYVQRRTHALGGTINDSDFEIDRFNITTADQITYETSSGTVPSYAWYLMAAGSPIELSPDESSLAVMARTQNNSQQEIYLFDPATLTGSTGTTINISELWLEFPTPVTTGVGTSLYHQPLEFDASAGTGHDWLRNFEKKISGLEFSSNGDYLYICGGGYVASGTSNLTYLAQIELGSQMGPNNDPIARYHVQTTDPGNTYNATSGGGPTWNGAQLHQLLELPWNFAYPE